ncbi:MAG TPA: hypothetical protein PKC21_03420 [Oligoflexia bacterium]|nr:hypothetical protein [Oligoflexia bacterium]HMR24385.1 hypothetical protein [Oligoflexia bacterium]
MSCNHNTYKCLLVIVTFTLLFGCRPNQRAPKDNVVSGRKIIKKQIIKAEQEPIIPESNQEKNQLSVQQAAQENSEGVTKPQLNNIEVLSYQDRIIQKILKNHSIAELNENTRAWLNYATVHVPDQVFDFGLHFYAAANDDLNEYHASNIAFDLQYAVLEPIVSKKDAAKKIKLKIKWHKNSVLHREVYSTLCPEQVCIPSFFKLSYNLETKMLKADYIEGMSGPLKYDFQNETHHVFTAEDMGALNCILNMEIDNPDSFLWENPIERYLGADSQASIDIEPMKDRLDGITGATDLVNAPYDNCPVPKGGLWTTVTVFAHGYEMYRRIDDRQIEDWLLSFEQPMAPHV